MDKKIDLLSSSSSEPEALVRAGKSIQRSRRVKPAAFIFIFLLIVYVIFSFNTTPAEKSDFWFYNLPIISQIKHLVESADAKLKGEDNDRINILLLGIGGKGHDGGLLNHKATSQLGVKFLTFPQALDQFQHQLNLK